RRTRVQPEGVQLEGGGLHTGHDAPRQQRLCRVDAQRRLQPVHRGAEGRTGTPGDEAIRTYQQATIGVDSPSLAKCAVAVLQSIACGPVNIQVDSQFGGGDPPIPAPLVGSRAGQQYESATIKIEGGDLLTAILEP